MDGDAEFVGTGRAKDLEVKLVEHDTTDERGSAHWLADYTFSTGRRVHNDVRAHFRFEHGLITEHRDSFSFYAWARQVRWARSRLDPDAPRQGTAPGARDSTSSSRKRARSTKPR